MTNIGDSKILTIPANADILEKLCLFQIKHNEQLGKKVISTT